MKLLRFRVHHFRSVDDSGWVDSDDVTALIGINESGKTNLLLPLWKFSPAEGGKIDPASDFPRKLFNDFRKMNPKPIFIETQFSLNSQEAAAVATLAKTTPEQVEVTQVTRNYDGEYTVGFPNANVVREIKKDRLIAIFSEAKATVETAKAYKGDENLKAEIPSSIVKCTT